MAKFDIQTKKRSFVTLTKKIEPREFVDTLCDNIMNRFFNEKTGMFGFESKREIESFDVSQITKLIKLKK